MDDQQLESKMNLVVCLQRGDLEEALVIAKSLQNIGITDTTVNDIVRYV